MKTITQQREQCGWSQEEAAAACGIRLLTWDVFEGIGDDDPKHAWDTVRAIWDLAYKSRQNDMYGWLLGDWEFDSVGPC